MFSCRQARSCPARNAKAKTPPAIKPFVTPSILPPRAEILAHCIATLLRASMAVFSHKSFTGGEGRQSSSAIRLP
jgi:hypothetical protein